MQEFEGSLEKLLAYPEITFDIDGVLAMSPASVVDYVNDKFGTDYKVDQIEGFGWLENSLAKRLGISYEEAYKISWFSEEPNRLAPAIENSKAVLMSLALRGASIKFVTSRPSSLKNVTEDWLKRNYPFLKFQSNLYVTSGSEMKAKTIKQIKPACHVDDSYEFLVSLDGIPGFLIAQNWNLHAPQDLRMDGLELYKVLVYGRENGNMSHNVDSSRRLV